MVLNVMLAVFAPKIPDLGVCVRRASYYEMVVLLVGKHRTYLDRVSLQAKIY